VRTVFATEPDTGVPRARGSGWAHRLILDGGATTIGVESTVLDLSGDAPILRPAA
jgi:hypothetical protein